MTAFKRRIRVFGFFLSLGVACNYDWATLEEPADSGAQDAPHDTTIDSDEADVSEASVDVGVDAPDAPDSDASDGSVSDADAAKLDAETGIVDAGPDVDAGLQIVCSLNPARPCPSGMYCDYPADSCGGGTSSGVCALKPTSCSGAPPEQVCACDGQVRASRCQNYLVGADNSSVGGCAPPLNTFACGPTFCVKGSQTCYRKGAAGGGYDYSCYSACSSCASCLLNGLLCLVGGGSCDQTSGNPIYTCP